jgi:tRNA pseudouridine13 synthase
MTTELPYAHGEPPLRGRLRATPDDFFVDEILGFDAGGEGEHFFVHVEKRGENTEWVARELAKFTGTNPMNIGYAGMKDRHALTRQTFSVQLPGKIDPDWTTFASQSIRILSAVRHNKKIKRGGLRGNRFVIVLRDVEGSREAAEARLASVQARGVPNYFGEQRFGREGSNVPQALAMFGGRRVDRNKRSMLLSAARSHLFNAVLAARAEAGQWDTAMDGELFSLAGSRSWFGPEPLTDELSARLAAHDIHPSGPLWGRGDSPAAGAAGELEQRVAAGHPELAAGVADAGMDQERRALRLIPGNFTWQWLDDTSLQLSFDLPAGAYATTVIREVADVS